MAKRKTTRKARAAAAPKPKHVTVEVGQRLLVHVVKKGRPHREFIAGANEEGAVTAYEAPEAAAPVSTPSPISGT